MEWSPPPARSVRGAAYRLRGLDGALRGARLHWARALPRPAAGGGLGFGVQS